MHQENEAKLRFLPRFSFVFTHFFILAPILAPKNAFFYVTSNDVFFFLRTPACAVTFCQPSCFSTAAASSKLALNPSFFGAGADKNDVAGVVPSKFSLYSAAGNMRVARMYARFVSYNIVRIQYKVLCSPMKILQDSPCTILQH